MSVSIVTVYVLVSMLVVMLRGTGAAVQTPPASPYVTVYNITQTYPASTQITVTVDCPEGTVAQLMGCSGNTILSRGSISPPHSPTRSVSGRTCTVVFQGYTGADSGSTDDDFIYQPGDKVVAIQQRDRCI